MEQLLVPIWKYLDYIINQLKQKPVFQILRLDNVDFYIFNDEDDHDLEKVKIYIAFDGQKKYDQPDRFYVNYRFKIPLNVIVQAQPEKDADLQKAIVAFENEAMKDFLKQQSKNEAKITRLQAENKILSSFAIEATIKTQLLAEIANEKPDDE